MILGQEQLYLFADPVFYDTISRWDDEGSRFSVTGRAAPPGWHRVERDPWVSLRPADVRLPDQGWKIHVAGHPDNAERICAAVWEYCVPRGQAFKFLRGRNVLLAHSSKYAPRASSGKLLTIYPADEATLHRTLTELGAQLDGEAAPYILSDVRWAKGPLYVRYGGFVEKYCAGEGGHLEYAITGPDGQLVPDRRRPVFEVPPWVAVPDFLGPHVAARRDAGDGGLSYRITKALHFSNGGGVYLADQLADGGTVVLKEARPLAGLDNNEHDAIVRLRRERWALQRLAGVAGVPKYYDHVTVGEHEFLVEEYVAGRTLQVWQATEYPLVIQDKPTAAELDAYAHRARAMYRRLHALMERIHARGVAFGDLHPANVMVRPDGTLVLVDFELAHDVADDEPPGLGAAGFAGWDRRGVARDRFGAAAIGLWLFLPLNRVLVLAPEKIAEYIDAVAERFDLGAAFLDHLRRELGAPAPVSPASLGILAVARLDEDTVDRGSATRSMAAAVLLSATPEREDRLFPGDIRQFTDDAVGFAYGAGGVLWALSMAGFERQPVHEEWFVEAALRGARHRPGFYVGLHGLAYLADHFGRREAAVTLMNMAVPAGNEVRGVDLFEGLAGIGLNLLHFAERTGDSGYRHEALVVATRIAEALNVADDGRHAPTDMARAGLMRGWSGPALFFTRLASATGDGAYLDLAVQAALRDLDRCVATASGSLQVEEAGVRTLSYLDVGSAGIALVLDEVADHREDERLAEALPGLVRACSTEFVLQANLLFGRAGLLAAVNRAGRRLDSDLRPILDRHLRRLAWHATSYRGHLAFPGNQSLRLSMDLATGTAGVLFSVHAATAAQAPFLPFFSTRPGWCGRGSPTGAAAACLPIVAVP